ncbi:2,3-bisphosphoglycerate-dependent phosphoglycerate mutase [Roseibium hamelinense]|uniref:2,3-bisphosphoglycerate-dependent phosphoglycerate mutase n=1 Tax=Roseibium hamelinense TaxID=150831 RepID=A0A562THN5_9HYPH|nr:histidine phosphatase family protein [Roseibium hamelinense]MTI45942.1 histidine phosphatase family protein [Roseibium hamelinense]TWI92873.1 2,3-bisphosphoglycerate-dependent phosphoglycerate mutase [Roseibium hamelinense]
MSSRIAILIRHGDYHQRIDAPSALQPFPLTEKGAGQAKKCAEEVFALFRHRKITINARIICSKQLRAYQTATILGAELSKLLSRDMQIVENEALAERSVGAVANLTTGEIEAVVASDPRYEALPRDWKSKSDFRLPFQGAESLNDAGARVASLINTTLDGLPDSTPPAAQIFVGHGASIRHAATVMGLLRKEDITRLSMYHARPVCVQRDASGSWTHVCGEWKPRKVNETPVD